jgi:hypothetical protein
MKQVFQCDWCGERGTEEEIRCHEPLCTYNKELRSCYTCKNQKGLMKLECPVKEIPEGKYISFCPLWEDNGKDMTKPVGFNTIFGDLFGGK